MTVTVWSACACGLVAALTPCALLMAQETPPQKCVFEGTARNSVTLLALGKATIRLIPTDGSIGYSGSSKTDGSFRFEDVAAGDYRVEAERTGYAAQWLLADRSGHSLSTLHLAPGQVFTGNDLWFTPDGAVSGKVIGPDGEPLASAHVQLIERKWRRGKRVYVATETADADDAGVFRFGSVPAGRYRIYASRPTRGRPLGLSILEAPGKPEMRIAGRYHPNAAELDGAQAIEVHAGEEVTGIDFILPLAPVFHLAGNYPGAIENLHVGLNPRFGDQVLDWDGEGATVGKDGKFDFAGVFSGSYFLFSYQPGVRTLTSANLPVTVATQNIAGLAAPPVGRFEVKGRVCVEGNSTPDKIPVVIFYEGNQADDFSSFERRAEPQPGGAFTIGNLTPDRYHVRIENMAGKEVGYYLKSLRVNGVDVAGHEIDLTAGPAENVELLLSAAGGSLEGTVIPPEERPDNHDVPEPGESTVVIVPEKLASGDTQPVNVYLDQAGHFQVTDLEPGSYRVFALTYYEKGLWQSLEFLRQIASRGVAVEVAEKAGAKVEVHALRAGEVRQVEERIP